MVDVVTVLSSAGVSAILGPTISYFLIRHFRNKDAANLAQLSEDLVRETKRIEAERSLLQSRLQMQYSWLYQERAKIMSEVYQAVVDASDAFEEFLRWKRCGGFEPVAAAEN